MESECFQLAGLFPLYHFEVHERVLGLEYTVISKRYVSIIAIEVTLFCVLEND